MVSCHFFTSLLSPEGQDCILEPLSFPEVPGSSVPIVGVTAATIPCVLCPDAPPLWEKESLLKHMLLEHKLVIADVRLVADFPRYLHSSDT